MVNTNEEESFGSVFLFGTGRSGTTLLNRMFGCHPDLAWFSTYHKRFPRVAPLALFSRFRNWDSLAGVSEGIGKYLPLPIEAITIPQIFSNDQFHSQHILTKDNIDYDGVRRYQRFIRAVMQWQGKKRFLHKHTGFARLEYLSEVDPGGQFVQIIRDGRAVAYSLMRVKWWDGTLKGWGWGEMPETYLEEYRQSDSDRAVLAGIMWKQILDFTAKEAQQFIPEKLLTIRFNEFLDESRVHVEQICRHCDLAYSARFQRRLQRFEMKNVDEAWKSGLTSKQVEGLNRILEGHLETYGFAV